MDGEKFKLIRTKLGDNQKVMATKLGITQSYYSALERGEKPATAKLLKILFINIGVSSEWWYSSNGDIFSSKMSSPNVQLLSGDTNFKPLLNRRNFKPYDFYNSLPVKELDVEISIELEDCKDVFEDLRKLTEFLHKINAPAFLKDKFPLGPDFETFNKEAVEDFLEMHAHLKDEKQLKVFTIVDLYQADREHWQRSLSQLINYLHNYADWFNDPPELNNLHKDSV